MSMYLIDTNVVSELFRRTPAPSVLAFLTSATNAKLSVITVEEMAFGLNAKPNVALQTQFDAFISTWSEIIPISTDIALRAGALRGRLRTRGRSRTQADMLIAATAQALRLTLVTRNTRDFDGCGIALLNPF
jgi:toxin FitB